MRLHEVDMAREVLNEGNQVMGVLRLIINALKESVLK